MCYRNLLADRCAYVNVHTEMDCNRRAGSNAGRVDFKRLRDFL